MEFDFMEWESDLGLQYIPALPVRFNGFPVGHVLVDTGATVTILPMVLREVFGVDLDKSKALTLSGASGERFIAYPSSSKVTYSLEQSGFRPLSWNGVVFFVNSTDTLLLGHYQCLDQLITTFDGPRRKLKVEMKR